MLRSGTRELESAQAPFEKVRRRPSCTHGEYYWDRCLVEHEGVFFHPLCPRYSVSRLRAEAYRMTGSLQSTQRRVDDDAAVSKYKMSAVTGAEHDIFSAGALSCPLAHSLSSSAPAWASGRAPRPARYDTCSAEHRHPSYSAEFFTVHRRMHTTSRDPRFRLPQPTVQRSQASPTSQGDSILRPGCPFGRRDASLSVAPPSHIGLPRQCHTSPTTHHATRPRSI